MFNADNEYWNTTIYLRCSQYLTSRRNLGLSGMNTSPTSAASAGKRHTRMNNLQLCIWNCVPMAKPQPVKKTHPVTNMLIFPKTSFPALIIKSQNYCIFFLELFTFESLKVNYKQPTVRLFGTLSQSCWSQCVWLFYCEWLIQNITDETTFPYEPYYLEPKWAIQ